MKIFNSVILLGAFVNYISAAPTSCTITGSSLSNISNVKKSCTNIIIENLNVPAGQTLDLTGLKKNTFVTFKGKTTFGYKEWEGPLISVSGTNVHIQGAKGNLIDCQGERWWDGKGGNGGKDKPKFFKMNKLIDSTIKNLNIRNTPVHAFSVNGAKKVQISSINLNNKDGDTKGGHNTDAFDVGSSDDVTISDSTIYNQDDCLAVNSGTNIKFLRNYCSGGHGISIGSVGGRSNNVVNGVLVDGCSIVDSDNGIRIKTVYKATGSVENITYQHITLKNIQKNGIVIQGDYENGSPTGTPTGGVPIKSLTIDDVKGNVASKGTNTYILVQNASNWKWSNINVTGGTKKKSCTGIPANSGAFCS
ncbi:glycoside hydrolase [Cunninghamella echinulata]|nr:glycoside hydrolase [Cunninghamella echinulata]